MGRVRGEGGLCFLWAGAGFLEATPLLSFLCRANSSEISRIERGRSLTFQPFGFRFEVSSSLPRAEAKEAIRSKKTTIFDVKNGARGWIAGPFICLWFSAFDRHGPMLFGLISADNFGTRVHGRAGSDLNGVLLFTLLIPLMVWVVFKMISEGQASGSQLAAIGLVFLVGGPFIYWFAHKDRKDAEPLVRFLRKTLVHPETRSKPTAGAGNTQKGLGLVLNGISIDGPVTTEAIQSAFMRVGNGDFLILEAGPHDYLQTACRNGGYILEVRKGGPGEHYQAIRNGWEIAGHAEANDTFTYEEALAALERYTFGDALPSFLRLEPMKLEM